MFGPLGFVPGITPEQLAASTKRGGWDAAGVPRVEDYMKVGAWFAGTPEELTAYLRIARVSAFPGSSTSISATAWERRRRRCSNSSPG